MSQYNIEANSPSAPSPATQQQHISITDNIPEQLKSNLHYFNLNNQLKYDLEQQHVIKLQQMEAIKLIQVSLEKLTATTTVPLHNQTTRKKSNSPTPSILVYKETSLHKNLLVSKILNKAKYFYYQSIVQTMRLSLMSKLNYYSSLIQQLYPNQITQSTDTAPTTTSGSKIENESSLVEEMKLLMQQILYDTYQFNTLNSCQVNSSNVDSNPNPLIEFTNFNTTTTNTTTNNIEAQTNNNVLKECSASDLNKPSESPRPDEVKPVPINNDINNEERIKQLTNVKHSLYSLLFPVKTETGTSSTTTTGITEDSQQKSTTQNIQQSNIKPNSQNENINKTSSQKRKCSVGDTHVVLSKRPRNYSSVEGDSLKHVILCDDTNVLCRQKTKPANGMSASKKQRRVPSKQHITSKLLKLSLKTATSKPVVVSQPESFMNLEVLV